MNFIPDDLPDEHGNSLLNASCTPNMKTGLTTIWFREIFSLQCTKKVRAVEQTRKPTHIRAMTLIKRALDHLGHWIATRASSPHNAYEPYRASRPDYVERVIEPGDVLLIEGGRSKISSAIKYLTQSSWSHAALYVGEDGVCDAQGHALTLIEAEIGEGIIASPLAKYASYNTRICRPVGLTAEDRARLLGFARAQVGGRYDMGNIFDILRYWVPNPPVPQRFRRRMIALGAGQPTEAICSTLIARAFEHIRYPILPDIEPQEAQGAMGRAQRREVLHIRDSALYTPRDFDISPFFRIIKPTLEMGFDYKALEWSDRENTSENQPS
jgi:hypothetical protein